MRKAAKQIVLCAAALALLCIACRFVFFSGFSIYYPLPETRQEIPEIRVKDPEVLTAGETEVHPGYLKVLICPHSAGQTDIVLGNEEDGYITMYSLRVDRFLTVYDRGNGNFTGDTAILIGIMLFWLLTSAIMAWHFFRAKGVLFYDYGTIYYSGFSLFALASGLVMLNVAIAHLSHPEYFSMFDAYSAISGASTQYMQITLPAVLLFAAAMAVSNIVLMRQEGCRPQNALGLLVSLLLIAGEAAGWFLYTQDFSGSELEGRIRDTFQNTYTTAFVYCQCMLTGAVICGIKASRHKPAPDKDFIIINGCWFRPDGTLPPLLRGRADKAVEFWRRQKAETGKEAFFIPTGGQGSSEPEAEAEAIRQYLLSLGTEDRLILPECRSVNTLENMAFSRDIIRAEKPEGKTVFSTSSYHVFRSGLWARQAGLPAEGIGSRTRWWFWPNAFMRETAGLLLKRWKQELLFLAVLIVFFGVLSMIL